MSFHWCDFCQINHSSVSCFHPGNPKNKGPHTIYAKSGGISRDDVDLEYAVKGTTERLAKAETLLRHVLSSDFYAQGRQKRGEAIEKFLAGDRVA